MQNYPDLNREVFPKEKLDILINFMGNFYIRN